MHRQRIGVVEEVQEVQALTHPVRIAALAALRTPESAAGVARAIGQSRQLVNYHLKELERAGLIVATGERRKGNFVEQLYQAVAGTFVVSPRLAWGGADRDRAIRDQASLERLIALGERLQRDASALLDRAAFDGEQIATATVEAEVSFADEAARSAFMTEYLAVLGPLLKKHGANRGLRHRVAMAVYPETEEDQ
ncbi:MAG TPA: helix-turn-helix domain-containing protein [Acidimicrobiales bacterium]|nr:helix-turn-helix domain-containing protein [Acidimicrobiales bacterium]